MFLSEDGLEVVRVDCGVASILLWDALNINNFYFIFLLFSDFIEIFFFFLLDNEGAHDIKVT